jgi:hypothetical protein
MLLCASEAILQKVGHVNWLGKGLALSNNGRVKSTLDGSNLYCYAISSPLLLRSLRTLAVNRNGRLPKTKDRFRFRLTTQRPDMIYRQVWDITSTKVQLDF